jgi:hypothetical protein
MGSAASKRQKPSGWRQARADTAGRALREGLALDGVARSVHPAPHRTAPHLVPEALHPSLHRPPLRRAPAGCAAAKEPGGV